jgi:hypothetical protein
MRIAASRVDPASPTIRKTGHLFFLEEATRLTSTHMHAAFYAM